MIARQEYIDRMLKLQKKVADEALDAFIVSGEESIYYLTGISYRPLERPFFIIVRPDFPPVLLVPSLEKVHLQKAPNVDEVNSYWDYPSPPGQGWSERLLALLDGLTKVGVEPDLPLEIYSQLAYLEPCVLPLIDQLRLIKSTAEVQMIRQTSHYADLAVEKVIRAAYYGVSDLELFAQGRAVQMQIMKDTDYDVLTTSVLTGAWPAPLSAQPHGVPKLEDRLKEGPHIALALMRVNGYAAECERTFFTAPPSQQVKEAFAAVTEARNRAFDLIKPGAGCAEIDTAANGFLKEKGYGDYLLHRTGHGFGLGNQEGPWVAEGSADVLTENMIISVEPGIYIPGVGGIRHSDTILVSGDGYESLTRYPADLESLVIKQSRPLNRLRGSIMRRVVGIK